MIEYPNSVCSLNILYELITCFLINVIMLNIATSVSDKDLHI